MGSFLSCEECYTRESATVITFSNDAVEKVQQGPIDEEEEIEVDDDGEDKNRPLIDSEWYEKLKCIDDSHSAVYGLTKRNFDLLMKNLERKVGTTDKERVDTICETKELEQCYKAAKCPIECREKVNKFIDCVDVYRLSKILRNKEIMRREQSQKK